MTVLVRLILATVAFLAAMSVLPAAMNSQAGNSVLMEYHDEVLAYCETEIFNATCPSDHVIIMTHARYGRMRFSRCVRLDYGHIGCFADVILALDVRCSGRQKCEIRIPDAEMSKNKPCPDDLKPYLEAGYRCVKVVWPSVTRCNTPSDDPLPALTLPSATLASLVSEVTGCGRIPTPWRIEVPHGQTIHLTLHDFGVYLTRRRSSSSPKTKHPIMYSGQVVEACLLYAVLWEPLVSESGNVSICGGTQRLAAVYSSRTNRLEIGTNRAELGRSVANYLLEYHAVGCADLPSSQNSMTVRNGDGTTIWCNFTRDIYHLKCSGSTWIGDMPNCSSPVVFGFNSESTAPTSAVPAYGLSIAIVLVIAIFIGNLVLFAGTVMLKRRRHRCPSRTDCRHSISLSDAPITNNKRCLQATLIRNDDNGKTCFDPGLYPPPKPPIAAATPNPPLKMPTDADHHHPSLYASLPTHKQALLAHLPCGCRAYADDSDLGGRHHHHRRLALCPAADGRYPGPVRRTWSRSFEALTTDNNKTPRNLGLCRQGSCLSHHQLDPSRRSYDPRTSSMPQEEGEEARAEGVARAWKGDEELPQVVTECRPLISVAAAAAVTTHGCLVYQAPTMLTYAVATLNVNATTRETVAAQRYQNSSDYSDCTSSTLKIDNN